MDRLCAGDLGGHDDRRLIEVAFTGRRGPDAESLVRTAHIRGVAVRFGIDHNALEAQTVTRPLNAQRDFASIGYENGLKHGIKQCA
ncbi:hypothetical protein ACVWXO_006209 [Bradyrhizobium sp. LM2.7]